MSIKTLETTAVLIWNINIRIAEVGQEDPDSAMNEPKIVVAGTCRFCPIGVRAQKL
jgi:hypothetical protein